MLEFIASSEEFAQDSAAQAVWGWVKAAFHDQEGVGYYRYPVTRTTTGLVPDICLFTRTNQPLAIRCLQLQLEEIQAIGEDSWVVDSKEIDSPLLELEDFIYDLRGRFD